MPHYQYFALFFWKIVDQFLHILMNLFSNDPFLDRFDRNPDFFENVKIIPVLNSGDPLGFPEMINDQVVCYPHSPLNEFSFFLIGTGTDGIDNFDESILKKIFCKLLFFNDHKDIRKNAVLMTSDQNLKAGLVSG